MSTLVETTFVANDFAWVERRSTPAGRLSLGTIRAATAETMCFFGVRVICELDGVRWVREEWERMHLVQRLRTVEDL